ncbi:MAG: hypothetical protein EGP80_01515 [Blautia wexlerae]|nr:hypothetical protein [Blautia wexlerae]
MQSLKSPYILYNQQSVGSTLHNNLLFITNAAFLVGDVDDLRVQINLLLLQKISLFRKIGMKKAAYSNK